MREHASGRRGHVAYFSKDYRIVMTGSKKHNQCPDGIHSIKAVKAKMFQSKDIMTNSLNTGLKFGGL